MECGCEYAYTTEMKLIERGYFIKAYALFSQHWNKDISQSELSVITDLPVNKIQRVLSYFFSRGIFIGYATRNYKETNQARLRNFIDEIYKGKDVDTIRHQKCWEGEFSWFLIHRYHKDVMGAISSSVYKAGSKSNVELNWEKVFDIVDKMYTGCEIISIKNVCEKINLSAVTLRRWKCTEYIKKIKEKQRKEFLIREEIEILSSIEGYFEINKGQETSVKELYEYIGINKSSLWQRNTAVTKYISSRCSKR